MNLARGKGPIKPPRLRPGDAIGVLSPSSGAAHRFPHVLDLGLRNIERVLQCSTREFPTTRMPDDELYRNPKRRAADINDAFADRKVNAIFATIGGDDSVRILPYLDMETILANPKILMGFSDTTTLTTYLNQHGLVTFNGPSVMAGFAQMRHLPHEFEDHVRGMLMSPTSETSCSAYSKWSDRYMDWNTPGYDGEIADLADNSEEWRWLQGVGSVEGRLFGGCIEVLEFMKGTGFWPTSEFWRDRVLFLETSEEKPTVSQVKYMLRNYGSMGVLQCLKAVLLGRARGYSTQEKQELYETIVRVVSVEFELTHLPVVANMDFGHTDPQLIMPLGIMARIDCEAQTVELTEPPVK